MQLIVFTLVAFLASWAEASANFKATCSRVNNQMDTLGNSINNIKSTARSLGHWQISSKCDEANNHLRYAQNSWGGISSGFLSFPWQARSSPHAGRVKSRLSSCGASLAWMYRQPELSHPAYQPYVSSCQANYNGCQSSCQTIWDWPSPPGYSPPQPSQAYGYYGRSKRHATKRSTCPANEDACPISPLSPNFECLDTQHELTSCGGCTTLGEGQDCSKIEGAAGVGCKEGQCVVLSTQKGYKFGEHGRPVRI